MGLLDALLGDTSGSGLLAGLPSSWQYQNPQDDLTKKQQPQIQYDQMGNVISGGLPSGADPFGPIPQAAASPQAAPPSVFAAGTAGLGGNGAPGPIAGSFAPPPAPIFAPQPAAPQAAPPIPTTAPAGPAGPINTMDIGGYQMPQYGSAADYTPPASVPAPVRAAMAQAPPDAPQELPQALGGRPTGLFDRINTGLQSLGHGGSIIGALTGNRTDPQSIGQQNLAAQYHSVRQTLIDNGEAPEKAASKAMLAVLNPEAGKTILSEALTNKEKYQVTKDDPLTGKQYGFVNERDQTINGKQIGSQGGSSDAGDASSGVSDSIAQARAKGATRDQLLQLVPSSYRPYVDAVLQDKALPTNMGRGAARMQIMGLAHAVDGNFNEEMIPTRIQMRKDFSGEGKNGQAIGSFNTAQHHIDKLSDDLEKVAKFQGNYPTINAIRSALANNANTNPELRDAAQSLNTDMAAVSHEIGTAYNAGHLSDHDMSTWNKLTNSNLPPDQLRRGMADFVDLLNGKRDSLNHMYRSTFGEDAPTIEKDKNDAVTAKVHQRSSDYSGSKPAATPTIQEGATATNPKTGQKITFINGKWQ